MANTYSAGIATAYGAAVRGGYTGTYEDFCRQQAGYADSAAAVEQAKADAETAADAAEASKTAAAGSASAAATSAGQASTSATNAANSATAANASKNAAATSATEAGNSATAAAGSAATAQGVLESIPPSYDDLADEVADLKEDISTNIVNLMGGAADLSKNVRPAGWETSSATLTFADNVMKVDATGQYGGAKSAVSLLANHTYYYYGYINATSNKVSLSWNGNYAVMSSGGGNYELLSATHEFTSSATNKISVIDGRSSGRDTIYVKDIGVIDLTACFGVGKEPTKAEMDGIVSVANYHIVGSLGAGALSQINAKRIKTLNTYVDAEMMSKVGELFPNLLGDTGKFSPSNSWYTGSATGYSVSSNVATATATEQYGGIKTLDQYSLSQNHIYYAFAKVKSTAQKLLTFDGFGSARTVPDGDSFVFVSLMVTGDGGSHRLTLVDPNSSDFKQFSVKECGLIDLTASFGYSVPTKEAMDGIIEKQGFFYVYPIADFSANLFLDATYIHKKYIDLSDKTVVVIGDSISETNYIIDGELTPHKTNWTSTAMPLLGNPTLYNLAQDGTSYHDFDTSGEYQTFTKQYNFMVSKGYDPDIIVVALGTNDNQWPNTDTYDSAMAVANKTDLDKYNLHQAVRWAYWTLTENYPDAVIIVGTPIQRANAGVFTPVRDAIIEMAQTYCLHIVDAMTESGIIKQFEVSGSNGRYLSDGLHPNDDGKELLGEYYARKISEIMS